MLVPRCSTELKRVYETHCYMCNHYLILCILRRKSVSNLSAVLMDIEILRNSSKSFIYLMRNLDSEKQRLKEVYKIDADYLSKSRRMSQRRGKWQLPVAEARTFDDLPMKFVSLSSLWRSHK